MPIIISKNGKDAKRVERTSFKEEEDLLKYIPENPDCIPIVFVTYKILKRNYTWPIALLIFINNFSYLKSPMWIHYTVKISNTPLTDYPTQIYYIWGLIRVREER